ncbi:MAG: hypothetical protein K4304_06775 [Propionicimonas sp.]
MTIEVDFPNMSLAAQVMTRQQGHAQAVSTHLQTYAQLSAQDMGMVLQIFQPINQALVDVGCQIMSYSGQGFELGADKMNQSIQAYVDADRKTYEEFRQVLTDLGIDTPPYSPPAPVTLGDAGDRATAQYSMADGNLYNQAFWDGYQAAQWLDRTATGLGQRAGDALSATRTVAEAVDASSFLTPPQVEDPEVENIRWSAGLILGGVDWIFEQIFGYSLLEEITKPFSGDWVRMKEASTAWVHTGDALTAMGQNTSGMVPALASWTGAGSEAFLVASALVAEAHLALQGPASTIATVIKLIAALAKATVALILKLLEFIQTELLKIAAEAAIPVGGWVLAAVNGVVAAAELVTQVRNAYTLINLLYDFVATATTGLDQLINARLIMVDLVEGLVRAGVARSV